jgi:hypothetical protein
MALVNWSIPYRGDVVNLSIDYLGPPYQPVIDIYSVDGKRHYGYWSLPLAPPGVRHFYVSQLHLAEGELYLSQRSGQTRLPGWQGERGDGRYRAYLFLWQGAQVARSIPLFEFTLRGSTVEEVIGPIESVYIG